ncbi:MAG TPA: biotin--[acetyl-CoA-carboxylase] ligase [Chloroflexi bacterium]|nr:biotin--[acetyl-CoA-carboxylase] ligase [Chloroflexota bacterium]
MAQGLDAQAIRRGLDTRVVGRALEVHALIDSTNARAVAQARAGAPEGLVVLAEEQTAGRGRLGRRWYAPRGSALLMSLLFRPPLAPMEAQRITMVCSLAVVRAVMEVCELEARIKWPNDIVLADAKLGGLLTELGSTGGVLDYVVVGIGLNVNVDVAQIPELMAPATSLSAEWGRPVSRPDLLIAFLQHADDLYLRLQGGWSPRVAWRDALTTLGREVVVGTPEETLQGVAEDVDDDGALLVRTGDGALRRVMAGDVTLRGHYPGRDSTA